MDSPKEVVIVFQSKIIAALQWRTCLNCEDWIHDTELCSKAMQRPPVRVIVNGCEQWIADIPF